VRCVSRAWFFDFDFGLNVFCMQAFSDPKEMYSINLHPFGFSNLLLKNTPLLVIVQVVRRKYLLNFHSF
jgi:hypothetical protein